MKIFYTSPHEGGLILGNLGNLYIKNNNNNNNNKIKKGEPFLEVTFFLKKKVTSGYLGYLQIFIFLKTIIIII